MRYHVLTVDYDGTLATDNHVSPEVVNALGRVKATGRKIILATGRELEELQGVFPEYVLFDRVVAENGALLYTPSTLELKPLGQQPPTALIERLKNKQVPLSVGRVIVSTWEPYQEEVLEAIKYTGVEYQVIFNKGAVMILPPGINKASGLLAALSELGISAHNVVAIGDAENDYAMLLTAEFSAAVGNAVPQLKQIANWTANKARGEGVTELIGELIENDLMELGRSVTRHDMALGTCTDGSTFRVKPYGSRMLLMGASSCGKTTMAATLIEKLAEAHYQFCVIDPEGDYRDVENVVTVGDAWHAPVIGHILQLLRQPDENVVICLLAIPLVERPSFFKEILPQITALRQQTGHPHFLIIDEAHHLLPVEDSWELSPVFESMDSFLAITIRSALLPRHFLSHIDIAMAMGDSGPDELRGFGELTGQKMPDGSGKGKGNILVWKKGSATLRIVMPQLPRRLLTRHKRKYASGDMGYHSFYFNGPGRRLNLKAQNLLMFMQMAEGVDDDTWLYHLRRHDYSNWFRNSVKNPELAHLTEQIEREEGCPGQSRRAIFGLIRSRYTAPV